MFAEVCDVTTPEVLSVPSMSVLSKLEVPSTSISPETSKLTASTSPATVTTALDKVIKSVSSVCPIVVPLIIHYQL